jgi:uncharacterized 2Fe-2S/4Fe-4S cluster protein (DUF4445 family)
MIKIKVVSSKKTKILETDTSLSLLEILRRNNYSVYAPCGGKGTCGKCSVKIKGEGMTLACTYYPVKDIEVFLPEKYEANILTSQTEFLEDLPLNLKNTAHLSSSPYGIAIDIGTTTIVMYFVNLLNGQIRWIVSFLNPQNTYGSDVISRINYCMENENGLRELQQTIVQSINNKLHKFSLKEKINTNNFERIILVGNTTMLHIILGADPVSIAQAPFVPKFTQKQIRKGDSTELTIHPKAELITLPCLSAYVGADILAGLTVLKVSANKNYLFLDIGTNGEIALIKGDKIFACAAAAGPAFEGANLSCGMGAVYGAISGFTHQKKYQVIGNTRPVGICGSGIVDIVAFLLMNNIIDETGLLLNTFKIDRKNKIQVTQQDIREIQLAKSAILSGIKILINRSGLSYNDIDALFLAGGFGNYINIQSALRIGLLPNELCNKIYPIGNSAGIGALQYLKSDVLEKKINKIVNNSQYLELSDIDEFTTEFALNMKFLKITDL